jgi:predicted nuclease of predicted toxin-antitoxin system
VASFFFDADADMRIGRRLERLGHLLTSAPLQHFDRASDREILLFAGQQRLILVTHNERDFVALHQTGAVPSHGGILVLPQVTAGEVATIAAEIDRLVRADVPLAGELYRLRTAQWERWDDEVRWLPIAPSAPD